jgi:aspartyl-tRNA(Asn)/glutamyl-tRNA(Gln) amidotransferase subunit A
MAGSSVDLRAEVDRRRAMSRQLPEGGPWVHRRESALEEAAAGGRPAGPLESVLVAVKELAAVTGLPLGAGNVRRSAGPPSEHDAAIVGRLRSLGAVVLGTVAMHELAFGTTGINDQVGFPLNPARDGAERIPGGSSSGSAVAVADGSCDLAVGSDTGGSVRIPAALCGVVGFKPSRGTYPLDGVLALSPSLDHVGLLARNVDEIAVAHRALVGETGHAVATGPPHRLGVDRAALDAASDEVAAAIDGLLRALSDAGAGVELVDVALPPADLVRDLTTTIMFSEAAAEHRELLAEVDAAASAAGLVGEDVLARLQAGATIAETTRLAALTEARELTAGVEATLATVDAVVGPTVGFTAPTVDEARTDPALPAQLVTYTRLGNLTGLPALTIPVPGSGEGESLPVGLQVLAADNAQALGVGLALQHPPS